MSENITAIEIVGKEALDNPSGYFGKLRDQQPVFWDERHKSWVITSYPMITAALRNPAFSSDRISPYIRAKLSGSDVDPLKRQVFDVLADWMVFNDEPKHMRLRGLLSKAFTIKSVDSLRGRVEALSRKLIEKAPKTGKFDLMEHIAAPLPSIIIAELLGVPPEDRSRFESWTYKVAPLVSGGLEDPSRYEVAAKGMDELLGYFKSLINRYESAPEDNLITALIQARDEGDRLSTSELLATCTLVLFGGHETTANLIANSIRNLLLHPDQLERLKKGLVDDQAAIEECLRYDGPGKALTRLIAEDIEFEGHSFKAGQRVFLILAAANRDPDFFENPEDFILDREMPHRHMAFGQGSHFCMGTHLARLEASIAIPMIVRELPPFKLVSEQGDWIPVLLTRGLKTLWVEYI
jgi:cytochrome P450